MHRQPESRRTLNQYVGKGEPNGTFYVHRRNSSNRNNLIQSSLSRVRGSKNTTGMGGVKGNTAVAHVTIDNVTAIMAQAPAKENGRALTAMPG